MSESTTFAASHEKINNRWQAVLLRVVGNCDLCFVEVCNEVYGRGPSVVCDACLGPDSVWVHWGAIHMPLPMWWVS